MNPAKLADTIRQITDSEGSAPALVCDAPGHDHGWVHLALRGDRAGWIMTMGYPSDSEPQEGMLPTMPDGVTTVGWEAQVHVRLAFSDAVSPEQIAQLIRDVMLRIQWITNPDSVEVALELM